MKKNGQVGLSIVEILIAISMSSVMMIAMIQSFSIFKNHYQTIIELSHLLSDKQLLLKLFQDEIHSAGNFSAKLKNAQAKFLMKENGFSILQSSTKASNYFNENGSQTLAYRHYELRKNELFTYSKKQRRESLLKGIEYFKVEKINDQIIRLQIHFKNHFKKPLFKQFSQTTFWIAFRN